MRNTVASACALASVCALALAAWLFVPREPRGARPPLVLCIVDASKSMTARTSAWPAWIRSALENDVERARERGSDVCAIAFGAEVKRLFGPIAARELAPGDDSGGPLARATGALGLARATSAAALALRGDESRWKSALDVALEILDASPRTSVTVRMYVDGTYTGPDPAPSLAALRARGAAIEWVDPPVSTSPDAALASLDVPEQIEPGAPVSVACDVRVRPGATPLAALRAKLRMRCERPSGVLEREIALALPAGLVADEDGYFAWRVRADLGRAEAGLTRVSATADVASDALPENDAASGTFTCGDALVAGWVGAEDADLAAPEWLQNARSSGGIQIVTLRASELPPRLASLDVLVTGDVDFERLPSALVRDFVERGGGWLSIAGFTSWRCYLAAGPIACARQDVTGLLPLEPKSGPARPRDVLFVLDASGSMVGEPFERAREAVGALLPLTRASDSVAVRSFSGTLGDAIVLLPSGPEHDSPSSLRAARETLAGLSAPGGPTALLRSLEEIAAARESATSDGLVLVFSDGRDVSDPDSKSRCRRIIERLAAARTALCVVATGEDPDRELLGALVPEGAGGPGRRRLLEARSLADARAMSALRELFEREIASDRLREAEALRVLPAPVAAHGSSSLASEIAAAQSASDAAGWPSVRRFVLARAAEHADVLWTSSERDPLLAVQRVGLGASAACAFAIPDWAPEWTARADLLAPLLRALGRAHRARAVHARIVDGELALEGLGAGAPALLEASVFDADAAPGSPPLATLALAPRENAIDLAERRSDGAAPVLARAGGHASLRVEVRAPGRSPILPPMHARKPLFELPLMLERAPEFRWPVLRIARASADEREVGARAPSADSSGTRAHPAAPEVLAAGLALLAGSAILGFFTRRKS
jgi:Mg-chelatase subunit ChlD